MENSQKGSSSRKRPRQPDRSDFLHGCSNILKSCSPRDQKSWSVETSEGGTSSSSCSPKPEQFLSSNQGPQGYCSFIFQDEDAITKVSQLLKDYPTKLPIITEDNNGSKDTGSITTADPFWIFVGRHSCHKGKTTENRKGSSEHTDDIQHDGTFHYQFSGAKIWKIRPTQEMLQRCKKRVPSMRISEEPITIVVQTGDILVLNTCLWWHATELPPSDVESISFARDIYLRNEQDSSCDSSSSSTTSEAMNFQEGAWAVGFLEKGTLLYMESEEPPSIMARAPTKSEANCQIIELHDPEKHEGCRWAIEALRDIQESEFFVLWREEKGKTR